MMSSCNNLISQTNSLLLVCLFICLFVVNLPSMLQAHWGRVPGAILHQHPKARKPSRPWRRRTPGVSRHRRSHIWGVNSSTVMPFWRPLFHTALVLQIKEILIFLCWWWLSHSEAPFYLCLGKTFCRLSNQLEFHFSHWKKCRNERAEQNRK